MQLHDLANKVTSHNTTYLLSLLKWLSHVKLLLVMCWN